MNLDLAQKVALVTAASRGIGRAVAYRLAGEGATVAISARATPALDAAVQYFSDGRGSLRAFPADLGDSQATLGLVSAVVDAYGRLDVLVVNTPGPPILSLLETDMQHWGNAYDQLLRPALQLALAAARVMTAQGSGSIVFLTSTWVKQPAPGGGLSAVMRAGIAALAKQLSIELAPHGVRVNQVLPGATLTDRTKAVIAAKAKANNSSEAEESERSIQQIPLGRMAYPSEIANAVAFLASGASGFTTGATLQVDGGAVRYIL